MNNYQDITPNNEGFYTVPVNISWEDFESGYFSGNPDFTIYDVIHDLTFDSGTPYDASVSFSKVIDKDTVEVLYTTHKDGFMEDLGY